MILVLWSERLLTYWSIWWRILLTGTQGDRWFHFFPRLAIMLDRGLSKGKFQNPKCGEIPFPPLFSNEYIISLFCKIHLGAYLNLTKFSLSKWSSFRRGNSSESLYQIFQLLFWGSLMRCLCKSNQCDLSAIYNYVMPFIPNSQPYIFIGLMWPHKVLCTTIPIGWIDNLFLGKSYLCI